jgi:hypothetical protein
VREARLARAILTSLLYNRAGRRPQPGDVTSRWVRTNRPPCPVLSNRAVTPFVDCPVGAERDAVIISCHFGRDQVSIAAFSRIISLHKAARIELFCTAREPIAFAMLALTIVTMPAAASSRPRPSRTARSPIARRTASGSSRAPQENFLDRDGRGLGWRRSRSVRCRRAHKRPGRDRRRRSDAKRASAAGRYRDHEAIAC